MKNIIFALSCLFYTHTLSAQLYFCEEVKSGHCLSIDQVLIDGKWLEAKCENLSGIKGFSCKDHGDLSKTQQKSQPSDIALAPSNAYVLFNQGYRTWVVKNGQPKTPKDLSALPKDFDIETIRELLPVIRSIFLQNHDLEGLSIKYSEDINIIVTRPSDENLKDEIIFTDYSAYEKELSERKTGHFKSLEVFPNPASDKLSVVLSNEALIDQIEILAPSGKIASQPKGIRSQVNNSIEINLANLKPGMYVVRVHDHLGRLYLTKLMRK